jgi:putative membrane protein
MARRMTMAVLAGMSLSLMGSSAPGRGARAIDDATILTRFEEMATADLGCAQLAAERAQRGDVKAFAAVLVREHTMARQMARDAALQLKVTLKPNPDNKQKGEHEKIEKELRERNDIAFDVLFVRHELEYHKALVAAINKDWMPAAQSADLQGFLGQVGAAFEAHVATAEQISGALGPKKP